MPDELSESELGARVPIPNLLWNLKTQFTGQENTQNSSQSHSDNSTSSDPILPVITPFMTGQKGTL